MSRTDLRRKSFNKLIEDAVPAIYRTQVELADALGFSPSHLTQMKTGARGIGNDAADRIEAVFGLGVGGLDRIAESAPLSTDEMAFQSVYASLPPAAQVKIMETMLEIKAAYEKLRAHGIGED